MRILGGHRSPPLHFEACFTSSVFLHTDQTNSNKYKITIQKESEKVNYPLIAYQSKYYLTVLMDIITERIKRKRNCLFKIVGEHPCVLPWVSYKYFTQASGGHGSPPLHFET